MSEAWPIHEDHPKWYIARSRSLGRVRRYCCDNCGRHHWGEYTGNYHDGDLDFEYQRADGTLYLCASGHRLNAGPEYCIGPCRVCQRGAGGDE